MVIHSESLPQSLTDTKTVIFKSRFDQGDIQLIGEVLRPRLFSRFGFKPRRENIRLLCTENYFEPYLIIGGKYALDYCKKHVFKVEVEERTSKVFIADQELRPEKSDPKASNRIIKIEGEERSHYEREAYFVLDRLKREIPAEKLLFAPFYAQEEETENKCNSKTISMSDKEQIAFLRTRIAKRPSDVGEIIKEVFDITDRIIAYYPMYQLTFENAKDRKVAIAAINGITGEVILNGVQRIFKKTIIASPKNEETHSFERDFIKFGQECAPITTKKALTKEKSRLLSQYVEEEAHFGDLEIPSGTCMNKTLFVKGALKIGDNCRIHGNLKALKSIIIGADTIIDGDLISGRDLFIGERSLISGSVETAGTFEIEENAIVEGLCIQRVSH